MRDVDASNKTWGYAYIYSSTDNVGSGIQLVETGSNTSIFSGNFNFTLTGSTTQQNSPILRANLGDVIYALYKDVANVTGSNMDVITTATVISNTGTVNFDKVNYDVNDTATVTVTDPDMNANPSLSETFNITVYSGADMIGISPIVYETASDTGIFTTDVTFSLTSTSGTQLKVLSSDTVTAKYTDDYDASGVTSIITANATVTAPPPPTPTSPLRLMITLQNFHLSKGEIVTVPVTVFNVVGEGVDSTLYIVVVGAGGYYHFDFTPIEVAANSYWSHSFDWVVPTTATSETYTISVGTIPPQTAAYDTVYVEID
jgi:hypothetical protein